MNVWLVDYLGVHCGMHYYADAFKKVIKNVIPNAEVKALSNYSFDKTKPIFVNQYQGHKIKRGLLFLKNLWIIKRFLSKHQEDIFIYLTYGNSLDILFLNIISKAKNLIVDVHEAIAQCNDNNETIKRNLKIIYTKNLKNVIVHSQRTDDFLDEYGFKGLRFHVPHFRYQFSKDYDRSKVGKDLINSIDQNKINILFFGNVSKEKGIDYLLDSINKLEVDTINKLNFIVAGKDFDGSWQNVKVENDRSVKFVLRHISDDELIYLFNNIQFLSLPYRKTSQSGVLEMAFYFRRPIIATDIPYFRKVLQDFPSFGILAQESYFKALEKVSNTIDKNIFFKDEDWDRYSHRIEVQNFEREFKTWFESVI